MKCQHTITYYLDNWYGEEATARTLQSADARETVEKSPNRQTRVPIDSIGIYFPSLRELARADVSSFPLRGVFHDVASANGERSLGERCS